MSKESKNRKEERKKPTMGIKERRAKKHEKRDQKQSGFLDEHRVNDHPL